MTPHLLLRGSRCCILFLLLSLLTPHLTTAYKYGDPVPMMKRSQYKGVRDEWNRGWFRLFYSMFRTEWTEVLATEAPKFGVPKGVRLKPLTDAKEYVTSDEYKMSFSFSGDRLLVPWIMITDGKAHFVESIDFYFQYSQGYINHVKWQTSYYADATTKPDLVIFRYHWEEILETDPAIGMNFLLIVSSVFTWLAALLILIEKDGRNTITPTTTAKLHQRAVENNAIRQTSTTSWTAAQSKRDT